MTTLWCEENIENGNPEGEFTVPEYILRGTAVSRSEEFDRTFTQINIPTDNTISNPAFDVEIRGNLPTVLVAHPRVGVLFVFEFDIKIRIFSSFVLIHIANPISLSSRIPESIPITSQEFTCIFAKEVNLIICPGPANVLLVRSNDEDRARGPISKNQR
jgi:hypothetical protein